MQAQLQVDVESPGQCISLIGRLDAASVADARAALHVALDAGTGDLLVRLSGLELGDVTGLGLLVGAHRRAGRMGRRLVLTDVPARVDRLLVLTRLHRILNVARTVQVA